VPAAVSDPVIGAFVVIPVLLVAALVWGAVAASVRCGQPGRVAVRGAVVVALAATAWMAATWIAAASGILRRWDATPPPLVVLLAAIVAIAALLALSGLGRRLARCVPLWALVGVQGFRLPLEIAMHEMFERGVMPEQMSYSGRNFDIVTGATALVVAGVLRAGRGSRALVLGWNLLGLALLLNIIVVAVLSTPVFSYFGSDRLNVWVADPPFVWLPAVMVLAALAGHLIVFRALREAGTSPRRDRVEV
jgi:hypothetical protein